MPAGFGFPDSAELWIVLLTGAAMMMRHLISLVRTDVGVETAGMMHMTIDLRRPEDTSERRLSFFGQLDERLASSPLARFALASQAPLGGARVHRVRIDGRPSSDGVGVAGGLGGQRGPPLFRRHRRARRQRTRIGCSGSSRRTREIGVRIALGADARNVWWTVTRTTLRQLGIGLILGIAGAAAVATVLPAFLVGTGGTNLIAFAAVAVLMAASGIVASAVPARRAIRLDPVTALQSE
jgi:hypothetical protein